MLFKHVVKVDRLNRLYLSAHNYGQYYKTICESDANQLILVLILYVYTHAHCVTECSIDTKNMEEHILRTDACLTLHTTLCHAVMDWRIVNTYFSIQFDLIDLIDLIDCIHI